VAVASDGSLLDVIDVPGQPWGVSWDARGRMVALTADGRLLAEEHGRLVELACRVNAGPAPCNELTIDAHGRAFVGIFGLSTGGLVCIEPDGSQRVVVRDLLLPNGHALSPDGRTLLVAESAGQRITALVFDDHGEIVERRAWATFGAPARATGLAEAVRQVSVWADGIALDRDCGVWVANPFGHEVVRVLEGGRRTHRISLGTLQPHAVALGGSDGHTLFICASPPSNETQPQPQARDGCLLATRVETPRPTQDGTRAMSSAPRVFRTP
jgi:YD repeat-containing protein